MSTRAGEILRSAADAVDGPRNAQHGDKERSFEGIAALWDVYLQHRAMGTGLEVSSLSGRDVAAMMVLLKIARSLYGEPITDHFMDMAGYAAIAGELAEEKDPEPVKRDPRSYTEWRMDEGGQTVSISNEALATWRYHKDD